MDLGLTQKEVARQIGATVQTIENWEKGRTMPEARHYPQIFGFLGYDPRPKPEPLGERIRWAREREGLSQRELARKLGLDPATVHAWEAGTVRKRYPRLACLFKSYVESSGVGKLYV
jgi:transcriptional regulator with XRE-family HTH domain